MKVLWICGLPNEVRLKGWRDALSSLTTPAWSWILGHLPPPDNIELHILCPVVGLVANRIDFKYNGAHWHCFRRKSFRHIFAYLWHNVLVRRFVGELKPDVVHGWGGETGFGYLATRISRNSVVSVQGLLVPLYKLSPAAFKREMGRAYAHYRIWREKRTYKRASILITESGFAHSALVEIYGHDSKLIPHPLREAFVAQKVDARRSATPKFVYVGSLIARKGALDVIKAFCLLKSSDAKLIMIGSGPEKNKIRDIIRENDLQGRVELIDKCSQYEIATIMRQSHFFTLPTYGDTGPTALKEALACGLFPICYDNSGPHEYLTRYCGYLVPTGDVEAYSAAMNKAVVHQADCIKLAENAASKIKMDLSKEMVWQKLEFVYKEILK